MQPVRADAPFDSAEHVVEPKLDGFRALAYADADGRVRLQLRSGREATARYPEVVDGVRAALAGAPAVLDGEICALDARGVPDLTLLLSRENARRGRARPEATALVFYAFDVLETAAGVVTREPLETRRAHLEELTGGRTPAGFQLVPRLPGSGIRAFDAALDAGLEGVVAKRRGSVYRPGQRAEEWVKVKRRSVADLVVGAWVPGAGALAGTVGALVVGAYDATGGLVSVGRVGTGFTRSERDVLRDYFRSLARDTPAFAAGEVPSSARFVDPRLVIEVAFHEVTRDGRLRAPSFVRARPDKKPRECRLADEVPDAATREA